MSPDKATIEPANITFHTENREMERGQKEYINIISC